MLPLIVFLASILGLHAQTAAPFQRLLQTADALVRRDLRYEFGSTDPARGALDCSGFTSLVFRSAYGHALPEESDNQYEFCRRHGRVWDGTTKWKATDLEAGDLIFITGTWPSPRPSPITHVMIYVGAHKMVGAQSGGKRLGQETPGVGYYDFIPIRPGGVREKDVTFDRSVQTVYAYARLFPAS